MSWGDFYNFVYLATNLFTLRWRGGFECGILKGTEGNIEPSISQDQNLSDKTETNRGKSLEIADIRLVYFCPGGYNIL